MARIIKREKTLRNAKEMNKLVDIENFTKKEIIAGIRDGGLTGMGGAGIPTR